MSKRILLTGITGLIGKSVLTRLLELYPQSDISAFIRPTSSNSKLRSIPPVVQRVLIDLADIDGLKRYLETASFDVIIHLGALRGGRKASRATYYRTNVMATEQLIDFAYRTVCHLIFCSSVGVFGAIPKEMPANNETPYQEDNYYHYTKVVCEKRINQAILKGLSAIILRPSITYGIGDKGFPWQLIKLVAYRIMPITNKNVWIHLCHIDTITAAFVNAVELMPQLKGKALNIADMEPVQLRDLVNFISRQVRDNNYPAHLNIDSKFLSWGEGFSKLLHNELWTARFQLISKSWIFDVQEAYNLLHLPEHYTVPDFKFMTDHYMQRK